MFLLKWLILLIVIFMCTDGILIRKNTGDCCILPPLLNNIKRNKCLTALGITPTSKDDSLKNECLLQCMMDNVLQNNTLDKTALFQFVKNQIGFPFQNIWERPLAAAVEFCANEVNKNLKSFTLKSIIPNQSCFIGYSFIIGCIFYELSQNCPYIALNTTDLKCANLTRTILKNYNNN